MANGQRGEVTLPLGEREIVLRPSFENLADIENRLGYGIVKLCNRIAAGDYGLLTLAVIVHACMPKKDRPAEADIGRQILKQGMVACTGPIREFLILALAGEGTDPGAGGEPKNAEGPPAGSGAALH